jgi:hypothetical protein
MGPKVHVYLVERIIDLIHRSSEKITDLILFSLFSFLREKKGGLMSSLFTVYMCTHASSLTSQPIDCYLQKLVIIMPLETTATSHFLISYNQCHNMVNISICEVEH